MSINLERWINTMEKNTNAVQLNEFREAVVNWENNLYRSGSDFENYKQQIPILHDIIMQQYEMCWKGNKELEEVVNKITAAGWKLNAHIISMSDVHDMVQELSNLLWDIIDAPRIAMLKRVKLKIDADPELLKEVDKFIKKYYSEK